MGKRALPDLPGLGTFVAVLLRRNRRAFKGEKYEDSSLMHKVRTAKASRHELAACILALARFRANWSELEMAARWYADSTLGDLLAVTFSRTNDARLCRGLDVLHAHKTTRSAADAARSRYAGRARREVDRDGNREGGKRRETRESAPESGLLPLGSSGTG